MLAEDSAKDQTCVCLVYVSNKRMRLYALVLTMIMGLVAWWAWDSYNYDKDVNDETEISTSQT